MPCEEEGDGRGVLGCKGKQGSEQIEQGVEAASVRASRAKRKKEKKRRGERVSGGERQRWRGKAVVVVKGKRYRRELTTSQDAMGLGPLEFQREGRAVGAKDRLTPLQERDLLGVVTHTPRHDTSAQTKPKRKQEKAQSAHDRPAEPKTPMDWRKSGESGEG